MTAEISPDARQAEATIPEKVRQAAINAGVPEALTGLPAGHLMALMSKMEGWDPVSLGAFLTVRQAAVLEVKGGRRGSDMPPAEEVTVTGSQNGSPVEQMPEPRSPDWFEVQMPRHDSDA